MLLLEQEEMATAISFNGKYADPILKLCLSARGQVHDNVPELGNNKHKER
jgi:hypothetical protein